MTSRSFKGGKDPANVAAPINWMRDPNGPYNSEELARSVTAASGIPIDYDKLRRLQTFRQQVTPIRHHSCPVGWEEHTGTNPPLARQQGVGWINTTTGNWCSPAGDRKSTLVRQPGEVRSDLETLRDLKELNEELEESLNPNDFQERRDARKKRAEAATEANKKATEQRVKQITAKLKRMLQSAKLQVKRIYKQYGTGSDAEKDVDTERFIANCLAAALYGSLPPAEIFKKYGLDDQQAQDLRNEFFANVIQKDSAPQRGLDNYIEIKVDNETIYDSTGKQEKRLYAPSILANASLPLSPLLQKLSQFWKSFARSVRAEYKTHRAGIQQFI